MKIPRLFRKNVVTAQPVRDPRFFSDRAIENTLRSIREDRNWKSGIGPTQIG